MNNPTVSVIIPIYNTAQTLPRCIDSVLAQSFDSLEIVLVDDGSPDGAGAIADDYASRHSCITVVHQPNAGVAEARRAGLAASRGALVMPLDSDDTLPPQAVATLCRHLLDDGLDMAFGNFSRVRDGRERVVRHHRTGIISGDGFLRHLLDPRNICSACGNIARREVWRDDVFPPTDVRLPSEDMFMLIRLTQHLSRVGLYDDVTYNYHYNARSLSIAGPQHRQQLWQQFFELTRAHLTWRGVLDAEVEQLLRAMEIERLAFVTRDLDPGDDWVNVVIRYDSDGFTPRVRLLQRLLRWPALLRWLIVANRRLKRCLNQPLS